MVLLNDVILITERGGDGSLTALERPILLKDVSHCTGANSKHRKCYTTIDVLSQLRRHVADLYSQSWCFMPSPSANSAGIKILQETLGHLDLVCNQRTSSYDVTPFSCCSVRVPAESRMSPLRDAGHDAEILQLPGFESGAKVRLEKLTAAANKLYQDAKTVQSVSVSKDVPSYVGNPSITGALWQGLTDWVSFLADNVAVCRHYLSPFVTTNCLFGVSSWGHVAYSVLLRH